MDDICKVGVTLEGMEDWNTYIEIPTRLLTRQKVDDYAGWNMQAYPNDHLPLHMHCKKDNVEVKFDLDNGTYTSVGHPKSNDVRRLVKRIENNHSRIRETVEEIYRKGRRWL